MCGSSWPKKSSTPLTATDKDKLGRLRHPNIEVQVKSWSKRIAVEQHGYWKYHLRTRHYNELAGTDFMVPRFLVLVIVPDDWHEYANQDDICDLTLGPDLRGERADGVTAERGDEVLPHEQKMVNESGDRNGCFTCKAGKSGYRDGHWTGDHNPPNRLAPNGPWTLYPHCKGCSLRQGGIVNGLRQEWYK